LLEEPPQRSRVQPALDMQTRWLERQLARELGEKISIRPGANGDYVLQLGFADLAKLESSLQRLQELVRQIREVAGPRVRETKAGTGDR
jgi:hypothetical protein